MALLDIDTGQQLLNAGHISPETFAQATGQPAPVVAAPDMGAAPIEPNPMPTPTANISPTAAPINPSLQAEQKLGETMKLAQEGPKPAAPQMVQNPYAKAQAAAQATQKPAQSPYDAMLGKGSPVDKVMGSYGAIESAMKKESEAQAQGARQIANNYAIANIESARLQDQMRQDREMQQAELQKQQEKINAAMNDVNKVSKIDVNKFYKDQNVGQKIAGGLAVFLGGFLQGSGRTSSNIGLDIINDAVEKNIMQQKAEYERAKDKFALENNNYAAMRNNFQDKQQADQMTYAAHWQQVENQAKAIMARVQDPVIRAQMQQKIAGIEAQKNQYLQGAMQTAYQMSAMGGNQFNNPFYIPKEYQKQTVKLPNGKYAVATSEEGAKKINEIVPPMTEVRKTLEEMNRLKGAGLNVTETGKQLEQQKALLLGQLNKMFEFGALKEGDMKVLEAMIPDANSVRQGVVDKQIAGLRKLVEDKENAYYSQHIPNYKPSLGRSE